MVKAAAEHYAAERSSKSLAALSAATETRRQELFRRLNLAPGGTRRLVSMRADLLGMLRDERKPILSAWATLGSFIVTGSVPLLVYLAGLFFPIDSGASFAISALLSAAALFGLGAAKVLITERSWFRSGLEMLAVGGLAAGVAYLVGVPAPGAQRVATCQLPHSTQRARQLP